MTSRRRSVEEVFNHRATSVRAGSVAHVERGDLVEDIRTRLLAPAGLLLLHGFTGVGKSSALEDAVRQARATAGYAGTPQFLMPADLQHGLAWAFKLATRDDVGATVAEVATHLTKLGVLVVFDNLQSVGEATRLQVSNLAKHLADQASSSLRTKLIAVVSGSKSTAISCLQVPGIRLPIDRVEVLPWHDSELTKLVQVGGEACNMPFHDDITAEIAATSCGIPAVAHLMARTLAVHARDRKANFVSRVHFDYVLGNRGHLEEWAEQFLPAHLLGWYQGQTNAVLAVIAYAGRHRTPFSPAQLAVALPEFSAAELSEAFATARQSGVLRSTDDERSYEPLELIATIPAFWELHARSRAHKSGGSDAIAHLSAYDFSPARADTQDDRSLFNWLHLSDIHVGHPDAVHGWDQQLVLSELSRDIEDCTKREYPLPDALILTGDIAFSGQIEQYERARDFLSGLSTRLNINADRIFIVPGNHDVQRAVAQKDKDIERLVKSLRSGTDSLDDALARTRDSKKLAQRQRNYLDFVSNLSSTPGDIRAPRAEKASELFWSRSLQMRNGLMVRMVGINSSLLAQDDDDRGLLRIGMKQLAKGFTSPPPLSNEFVMALSHHPCIGGWLADEADVQSWLRRYAHVHLAGHVHESRSEQSRAGGGQSFIQIVAGAVHGDKLPPGVPASHGYNFGSVVSDGTGALSLRIWPRRWASLKKDFRVDVEHISYPMLYAEHELPIRLDVKEHA